MGAATTSRHCQIARLGSVRFLVRQDGCPQLKVAPEVSMASGLCFEEPWE